MGYNLYIGEAVAQVSLEDRTACVVVNVQDGQALGAPEDPRGLGGHENVCWPSYSVWSGAMAALGLTHVFFNSRNGAVRDAWEGASGEIHTPLIEQHPGAAELHPDHLVAFEAAEARWRARGPDLWEPGAAISYRPLTLEQLPLSDEAWEQNLKRIAWLTWWTRYSLAHHKFPTFYNS